MRAGQKRRCNPMCMCVCVCVCVCVLRGNSMYHKSQNPKTSSSPDIRSMISEHAASRRDHLSAVTHTFYLCACGTFHRDVLSQVLCTDSDHASKLHTVHQIWKRMNDQLYCCFLPPYLFQSFRASLRPCTFVTTELPALTA